MRLSVTLRSKILASLLFGSALAGILLPATAQSATNSEFTAAIAEYQRKNYKAAIQHLRTAIPVMERETAACKARLYLGHCYYAIGEKDTAIKSYEQLINLCFGSEEAKLAKQFIDKIRAELAGGPPASAPSATPGAKPVKAAGPARAGGGFMSKISVLPPSLPNHPAVSKDTIAAVNDAVQKLPKSLIKILDDSGATLTIAPNITDKWPNSANEGLGYEGGRTYGQTMYVFERRIAHERDNSELTDAWSPNDIKNYVYTQVGLAVLDATGLCKDKELIKLHKEECAKMPDNLRQGWWVFLQEGNGINETAAECIAIFLAKKTPTEFDRIYSGTKGYIKAKLGL